MGGGRGGRGKPSFQQWMGLWGSWSFQGIDPPGGPKGEFAYGITASQMKPQDRAP